MEFPENLLYTVEHEWVDWTPGTQDPLTCGITEYAADALGDIVFVQLPEVGAKVVSNAVCGELESTKSVSDLFSPVSGEVVDANQDVQDDPSLVNSAPFTGGWLFKVKITDEPADLMSADEYTAFAG